MSNLPLGSDLRNDAPWMTEIAPQKEVEVEIEVTYRKKVKVFVDEDFDQFKLENAVKEQILLPLEFIDVLCHKSPEVNDVVGDLEFKKEVRMWEEKLIEVNQI